MNQGSGYGSSESRNVGNAFFAVAASTQHEWMRGVDGEILNVAFLLLYRKMMYG